MIQFQLREASQQDGQIIWNMLNEIGPGEQGFSNSAYNLTKRQFKAYLMRCEQYARAEQLEPGHVPQTTYWFFRENYPVGVLKLRHHLNENLRYQGGHIGYAIRPTERAKGYGKKMLAAGLDQAKKHRINEVLLTIFENNQASRKMVERNGGRLERIQSGICYYWITLS